jgi:DNA-binding transcriptional LysR family regulator
MDTRALRYFQVVAEHGSYSRGAAALRISQPAVSRQIRKLEEDVGRRLFRRHGHGVALTEAGRLLLDRAQAAFRQLDQARAEIRGGSRPSMWWNLLLGLRWARFRRPWVEVGGFRWWAAG